MKGLITVTFSAKEAVELLSNDTVSKSLTNKVVKAFRAAAVLPQGAKASTVARATARVAKTEKPAIKNVANGAAAHAAQ